MIATLKDLSAKRGSASHGGVYLRLSRRRSLPHVDRRPARGGQVSCASHTAYLAFNTKARKDIMEWAEQLAPKLPSYRHHQTGEDNGDAHLKNLLLHHQVVLPITDGRIDFERGQRLFYCEFDGQCTKRVIVKVIGE